MDDDRVKDEFGRIQLTERLAKDRQVIAQYETGLAFHRHRVEDNRYKLGRLDEKLGGKAMTADEYIAAMNDLMRIDHEEFIADVRGSAERAEAQGRPDVASIHWDHVAALEAMEKPWEQKRAA